MSMISEQIKRLRDMAVEYSESICLDLHMALKDAADTIEELSAKLSEANMERSSAHYQGGWIPVSEGLPKDSKSVFVVLQSTHDKTYREYSVARYIDFGDEGYHWKDDKYGFLEWDKYSESRGGTAIRKVIAWRKPDPYREDVEDDKE